MQAKLSLNYIKIIKTLILLSFFPSSYLIANEKLEIEIDSPRFSEKGLDNRLYEIKADRGIQRENDLTLFAVEGKLRTDSGIWIYLNAIEGNFNQLKNTIELNGEITFYTDESDKLYSDYALFYIDEDLIEFSKNVRHSKENNIITSDYSRIKSNLNHIIYEGNVSTLYVRE